jgi:L-galactose dehydrogenase/L-glyceraldehyde 3-phosphate reductase
MLQTLKTNVIVGTKVHLQPQHLSNIEAAIMAELEESLRCLRREQMDLLQLHNFVAFDRYPDRRWVSVDDVYTTVAVFQKLQLQGKIEHWGINGMGEPAALQKVVNAIEAESIQCCYNLLNPSAGTDMPLGFVFTNYAQLIDTATQRHTSVIAVRVLAGGALSDATTRHLNGANQVDPIASGQTYGDDVAQAQQFSFLVNEGYVESVIEAAVRFVIGNGHVTTTLIGISNLEQ